MRTQKHLKLRTLTSEEVDLKTWSPSTVEDIHICLDMGIRVKDLDGEIKLNVTLASPEALRNRPKGTELIEKHTVVIKQYDYANVRKLLRELIGKCNRETRYDSCVALQKYFNWENEYCQLNTTH